MVAGVEIDFASIFAGEIPRSIGTSRLTTFPCLIFRLCEGLQMRRVLQTSPPSGALDAGLVRDSECSGCLARELEVEVPRFGYRSCGTAMGRAAMIWRSVH
ncbi:hypothetical protein H5410_039858 [Solanum commersonii]|uniref:Uncharacterized protein n=1 Tax=Solanum commersonii TaxID=4109 RepID=A0A9J5XQG4_SOLCO|nr:hypothetical protein H5410_039858 [Solanum commersonii]